VVAAVAVFIRISRHDSGKPALFPRSRGEAAAPRRARRGGSLTRTSRRARTPRRACRGGESEVTCGPHHHAPGRKCFTWSAWVWCVSRAARDSNARRVTVTRGAQGRGGGARTAGVKRASAFARLPAATAASQGPSPSHCHNLSFKVFLNTRLRQACPFSNPARL